MIAPMLSKPADDLPRSKNYIYEIKMDGQRTIAEVTKNNLLMYTRNFQKVTVKYPELENLRKCLRSKSAILDGEIVALKEGVPSFELLQQRMNLRDMRAIHVAVESVPVLYYAFDILEMDGISLLKTPLFERKLLLEKAVKQADNIKILPYFDSYELTEKAKEFGYEGVVAKKKDSPYCPGQRSDFWLKYKFQLSDSFVIGGWMEGGRSRKFGSLLVGKYRDGKLLYCGRVGTGFDESTIQSLLKLFSKLDTNKCPFSIPPKAPEPIHWITPKLVADVKFKEWTRIGSIRAPVFIALRNDILPAACTF